MTDFDASVRIDGGLAVIDLSGTIDGGAEPALDAAHAQLDEHGVRTVALDFTRVDYINSTGLAIIVQLLARARADRREVHAFGLSDHYREIFEITRLADFVTLHADRAAALA